MERKAMMAPNHVAHIFPAFPPHAMLFEKDCGERSMHILRQDVLPRLLGFGKTQNDNNLLPRSPGSGAHGDVHTCQSSSGILYSHQSQLEVAYLFVSHVAKKKNN